MNNINLSNNFYLKSKKILYDQLLKINGTDFYGEYYEISEIENEEELHYFQKKKLNLLVKHAFKNVDYYKSISKSTSYSNLTDLPILTKKIIKQNNLVSNDVNNRRYYQDSTGGSTGEPLKFIQDVDYTKSMYASNYYYHKNILGMDEPAVKKIFLWGIGNSSYYNTKKQKIINWLRNSIFLNSFNMRTENMNKYIQIINFYKPYLIKGYASSLYELSSYIEKTKKPIYSPNIIISAAENLRKEMREKIEEIFGTRVYDFYGSREISNLAGECEKGFLHISPYNIVEVLNEDNKQVKVGEEGRIVVTNLSNFAMPFIRYENGDLGIKGPKKCKCGNPMPTLKGISGRIIENFVREDGTTIPGEFFIHTIGVMYNKNSINKFQVFQEDYDQIKILTIPHGTITKKERDNIETAIKEVMGTNCNIKWKLVDEIPKNDNGKYQITRSSLWNN